jgi:hypothetical protein
MWIWFDALRYTAATIQHSGTSSPILINNFTNKSQIRSHVSLPSSYEPTKELNAKKTTKLLDRLNHFFLHIIYYSVIPK